MCRDRLHLSPFYLLLNSAVLLLIVSFPAVAQDQTQYDRGTPPQHAAGISGFGSYVSADVGTVNLSNGSLNMKLPLGEIGGRGFSIPLTLNYSSKVWSASKGEGWNVNYDNFPVAYASYAMGEFLTDWHKRITPGWTIGAAPMLHAQGIGIDSMVWPGCGYSRYLTKLTVSLPDKGEVELRDDYTDGAPHWATTKPNTGNCHWYDANRGRRWHAADGLGTIFISDNDNGVVNGDLAGWLITSDGMRYRFVNSTLPYPQGSHGSIGFAHCESITDRNGNVIEISYPASNEVRYTDQLGRITRIQNSVSDPQTGQPLEVLVTISGYAGQPRYYKVKSGAMNQNYRNGVNPVLPVINGAYNPMNYYFYPEPWWSNATQLFPESYCLFVEQIDNASVVNELVVPDGRSMRFRYNQYGEVAEVELPTGGKIQYDYEQITALPTGISQTAEVSTYQIPSNVAGIDRAITARRTYPDGATLEGSWSYSYGANSAQVLANSSAGILLSDQRHYFLPAGRYLQTVGDGAMDGTGYSLWSTGLESRSETRDASGGVISATEQDWTQRAPVSWWTGYTQQQPQNDKRISEQRNILNDGSIARTTTLYDSNNNPIEVAEYGFNASLVRRTVSTYVTSYNGYNYTDDTIRLLHLPLTRTVYEGISTQKAQITNEYDNYASDGNHAPLQDYGSVTAHDAAYGTNKTTRGNLTGVSGWLNTTGGNLTTYSRYDILGNVVSTKDPKGNISTLSFADDYGDGINPGSGVTGTNGPTYALPTLITSPPPAPGAPVHTARSQYDFSTGLLTGFRDRNNIVTQTIYNDPFNRPTLVKSAVGVPGEEAHAALHYAPSSVYGVTLARNDVLMVKDQTNLADGVLRSWTVTDGFGRNKEAWFRDPLGDVKVVSNYDGLGRISQTSNPYRPSLGEPVVYTTSTYDLAGRLVATTTADNAVVTTTYNGNTVTVTDQAGKVRRSVTDALGRLIQVYEDPDGLNYLTSYSYDTLDNLTTVSLGSQQRFFMYDSLKRLIRARNPEQDANSGLTLTDSQTGNSQWSIGYQYDNNGNLTQKTDARDVISTYAYDALNRNTSVTYTNDPSATATVTRYYDGWRSGTNYNIPNSKGRLWQTETSGPTSSRTTLNSFDPLGRPLSEAQQFYASAAWSQSYTTQRGYNLAGSVTSQTYPSGRSVNYSYDSAGRTNSFSGNLGGGANRTYASEISYSAFGGLKQEQFGTDQLLQHRVSYNVRGQTCYVALGVGDGDYGKFVYYYGNAYSFCSSGADNNGNISLIDYYLPGGALIHDHYNYDSLNRLSDMWEEGTQFRFKQKYNYDRYGNRTIDAAQSSGGVNEQQFDVSPANNRLSVPGGQGGTMSYDLAGNLTTDTYTGAGSRSYDAENRMTSAGSAGASPAVYTYSPDGQRVRRRVNGVETWHVYGMDGELLAEYAPSGATLSPQKEYGYRNGQLLVTTSAAAGSWGSAPVFANNPLVVGETSVQALHITQLRDAINALRGHMSMPAYSWQYSATTSDWISANPILDMRTALDQALGAPSTGHSAGLAQGQPIKAVHIQELRDRVLSAWNSGTSGVDISWLVTDHLGTPRMVIDKSGSLANVKRHDYLPFGEELGANTGGRTTSLGYSGDTVRQKFTSKERDNETGLDYFGARYYSSMQGRFTGVDIAGPNLSNPQSLNKYTYTLNNPLRYIDRNGLYEEDVHLHLTQALAEAAGFSRDQARQIAVSNQMTDETPGMAPSDSLTSFWHVEARRNYHFTTSERRQELWNNFDESARGASSETTTLGGLGVFMHAQQDSYSHEGYGPVLGHGMAGHAPDKTYNNPGKADRMALDSFNRLTTAATVLFNNQKISFLYKPLDQKVLNPLVQSFNRAKTPEEKMKIVNQIQTLARENIQRQAQEAIRKKQEEERRK
jgi:RHS repeat-associated protein